MNSWATHWEEKSDLYKESRLVLWRRSATPAGWRAAVPPQCTAQGPATGFFGILQQGPADSFITAMYVKYLNNYFLCVLLSVFRIRIKSAQWIRIHIQIRNPYPDPDPGGQKWPAKTEKSLEISCFEVLDVLFWGMKASPVPWTSFMDA